MCTCVEQLADRLDHRTWASTTISLFAAYVVCSSSTRARHLPTSSRMVAMRACSLSSCACTAPLSVSACWAAACAAVASACTSLHLQHIPGIGNHAVVYRTNQNCSIHFQGVCPNIPDLQHMPQRVSSDPHSMDYSRSYCALLV